MTSEEETDDGLLPRRFCEARARLAVSATCTRYPGFFHGALERGFRRCRHGKVTISRPHAVFPYPRIVGKKGGKRRIGAFDQARQPAILEPHASLGSVIEQSRDRVWNLCTAAHGEELADLGHRSSFFDGGEQRNVQQP